MNESLRDNYQQSRFPMPYGRSHRDKRRGMVGRTILNIPRSSTASSRSSSVTLTQAGNDNREGPLAHGPIGGHQWTGDRLTDHIGRGADDMVRR